MPGQLPSAIGGAPAPRVRVVNARDINPQAAFVLYWMIAFRRPRYNFSLDRAVAWSRELRLPLVVLESLRIDYPHASDRLHRFVLDGMRDNDAAFANTPVLYYPYIEAQPGAARGMLATLAQRAAVVVTDDFPCFFLPRSIEAAAQQVSVRLEAVDSNGLLSMSAVPQAYPAAVHFRRHMQSTLRVHLRDVPARSPQWEALPGGLQTLGAEFEGRWPRVSPELLMPGSGLVDRLPVDHRVGGVRMVGGHRAASGALASFVDERLGQYQDRHSHPDDRGTSRLSPYLHFGHVSAHEVFDAVMGHEGWNLGKLAARPTGARTDWWGVGPQAEAFLDQLVVWRELGFNTCVKRPSDYDRFEGLPDWARATLTQHAADPRPYVYDLETFERAETHDPLWNAAQREMLRDGWMHNYMRMLWGKKILEWSATPQDALDTMIALMNRWCLDGRDPNSYAGYTWILGRYDRPWPERPIYGTVRSMSSENTARKVRVSRYVAGTGQLDLL